MVCWQNFPIGGVNLFIILDRTGPAARDYSSSLCGCGYAFKFVDGACVEAIQS